MRAHIIVTNVDNSTTNFANAEYVVNVFYFLTDGTTFDQVVSQSPSNGTEIHVPFSLSPRKADALIRQKIADYVNSVYGVTIDPDDIYIPFSAH